MFVKERSQGRSVRDGCIRGAERGKKVSQWYERTTRENQKKVQKIMKIKTKGSVKEKRMDVLYNIQNSRDIKCSTTVPSFIVQNAEIKRKKERVEVSPFVMN